MLLYGWRKAGRQAESALAESTAKKGAGDGGRGGRRTEKPPSGAKTSVSQGSQSPREAPRLEADRKPRLLRTQRSCQPGLRRGARRQGWLWREVVPRATVRAQPFPPLDWPGSEGGSGIRRLRPRDRALLCELPRIYWGINPRRTTRVYPVGNVWFCRLPVNEAGMGGGGNQGCQPGMDLGAIIASEVPFQT